MTTILETKPGGGGGGGAANAAALPFTPSGSIAAGNTQAAVEEVAMEAASALTAHLNDAVDAHDASAISFSPTGTIAATDVQAAIAEVAAEAAGGGGAVPDRFISDAMMRWHNGVGAGDYIHVETSGVSASNPVNTVANALQMVKLLAINAADLAVTGKTAKLVIEQILAVNHVAPGINFVAKLFPITMVAGSSTANNMNFQKGAAIASLEAAVNAPAALSITRAESGEVTLPADGIYALGVTTSALLGNAGCAVESCIRLRAVYV